MATPPKTGPLSKTELEQHWKGVVDPSYARVLVEAGEGKGYEAHTQAFEQHARASLAVDRTTQALFILPWSGQSDEPASGPKLSTGSITLSRTKAFAREVTLTAAVVFFEEETTDFDRNGPIVVRTGRRYAVLEQRTLGPGERGPITVPIVAERPGRGYDNPAPDTIKRFVQPGLNLENAGASVVSGIKAHRLVVANVPDVVVPEHIGQYLRFITGANAGQRRRVIGYEGPDPPTHGGVALLAATAILRFSFAGGTFLLGERVEQFPSGAAGIFVHATANLVIIDREIGTFVVGQVVTGMVSGAMAMIDAIEQSPELVAETATASWSIEGWETDLGLVATNAASPTGGRHGMLDEIGAERKVARSSGESDEHYRKRVATPADVVAPNAIVRRANRVLAPFAVEAIIREVGLEAFRGFFYDVAPDGNPDHVFAWDMDFVGIVPPQSPSTFLHGEPVTQTGPDGTIARARALLSFAAVVPPAPVPSGSFSGIGSIRGTFVPGIAIVGEWTGSTHTPTALTGGLIERNRWKTWLDYLEFRAFFLVGVPNLTLGEFGLIFDVGPTSAYDAAPFYAFWDGFPATAAQLYRAVWQTTDEGRAGGVGFDLVLEP